MEIKVSKKIETVGNPNRPQRIVTKYFVNDILVATCEKWKEYFCTVKNGAPSLIRDKQKNAYKTTWNHQGLIEITGTNNFTNEDFKDDRPDLKWGHKGSVLNNKKVKDTIESFIKKSDPFNDPVLISFMEEQAIDGWKDTLDGLYEDGLFIPQHKEAYYGCKDTKTIEELITKFEAKFKRKLKYRQIPPSLLFYISYEETELGPEYDRTVLNNHLLNK